jgi:serine/threonine protein kinase
MATEPCPTIEAILSRVSDPETKILGRGNQGIVYKIGNFVFKKVRFNQKTPQATQRDMLIFQNEAEIVRILSSKENLKPFVPQFCWYKMTNEYGYLLQRYEPVKTLHDLIVETPEGTLPFSIGIGIFKNLVRAVLELLKERFYHRDIKPDNILIRTSSEEAMKIPILVDFGLACPSVPMSGLISCKDSIKGGTPTYMVPNFLPHQIHQKQKPFMQVVRKVTTENGNEMNVEKNLYVKTTIVDYHVSRLTELYALALTLKKFYPIIDFTGHRKDESDMLTFIAGIEQDMKMHIIKRRRNALAKRQGWGTLNKYTVEGVGTAVGGTRKKRSQKKRRQSRKS